MYIRALHDLMGDCLWGWLVAEEPGGGDYVHVGRFVEIGIHWASNYQRILYIVVAGRSELRTRCGVHICGQMGIFSNSTGRES